MVHWTPTLDRTRATTTEITVEEMVSMVVGDTHHLVEVYLPKSECQPGREIELFRMPRDSHRDLLRRLIITEDGTVQVTTRTGSRSEIDHLDHPVVEAAELVRMSTLISPAMIATAPDETIGADAKIEKRGDTDMIGDGHLTSRTGAEQAGRGVGADLRFETGTEIGMGIGGRAPRHIAGLVVVRQRLLGAGQHVGPQHHHLHRLQLPRHPQNG